MNIFYNVSIKCAKTAHTKQKRKPLWENSERAIPRGSSKTGSACSFTGDFTPLPTFRLDLSQSGSLQKKHHLSLYILPLKYVFLFFILLFPFESARGKIPFILIPTVSESPRLVLSFISLLLCKCIIVRFPFGTSVRIPSFFYFTTCPLSLLIRNLKIHLLPF